MVQVKKKAEKMQITSRGKTGPETIILCKKYEVYTYAGPVCSGIQVT
jgi:hypothetical protein